MGKSRTVVPSNSHIVHRAVEPKRGKSRGEPRSPGQLGGKASRSWRSWPWPDADLPQPADDYHAPSAFNAGDEPIDGPTFYDSPPVRLLTRPQRAHPARSIRFDGFWARVPKNYSSGPIY